MEAVRFQAASGREETVAAVNHSAVFVIRKPDLDRTMKRFSDVQLQLRVAMGSVWIINSQQERDELLQRLSNVPEIRAGLNRLNEARRKTQEAQSPSPRPKPSEKA